MKISDILNTTTKTLFSFEILPPLKGATLDEIYQTVEPLMEFNPPYINVTYHREEVLYNELPNGAIEKRVVKKRPGTVGIAAALKYHYKVNVVPHIICGGFSKDETENALIDLHFLGINNVLAVRGDAERGMKSFQADPQGHGYAVDLVRQIVDLNNGKYLDEDLENATATDFCIGVAGYPEKHSESPNYESDIRYLKQKVNAGADYIVTQLFFDNQVFFDFVDRCRKAGILVPIVAGIKPLSVRSHLQILPKTFGVSIPDTLVKEVEACKDNKAVRAVGIDWATQQTLELIKHDIPAVHFYTMGKSDNIKAIAKRCF